MYGTPLEMARDAQIRAMLEECAATPRWPQMQPLITRELSTHSAAITLGDIGEFPLSTKSGGPSGAKSLWRSRALSAALSGSLESPCGGRGDRGHRVLMEAQESVGVTEVTEY